MLRGLLCAGIVLLLVACGGGGGQPFAIGSHRGTLQVPAGWSVVDLGERWEVRKGEASIVLHDLGPASPAAIARAADRIIALWRGGDAAAAQAGVQRLWVGVRRLVPEPHRRPLMNTMAPLLEPAALGLPEAERESRFADWKQAIAALPPADLAVLGAAALAVSGHDQRRSIHSQSTGRVGGRPAIDYLTVTRSTQGFRKRIVAIDVDGELLAVYFGILGHDVHLPEFDRLVRSLQFAASDRR